MREYAAVRVSRTFLADHADTNMDTQHYAEEAEGINPSKLMAELYPELHQAKLPSRNLRPTEAEMAKALTASRGKYGTAARRLQCSERTLRRYVADSPALQELVSEQRELLIDEAEDTIDAILNNSKHPRQFDAAKFIERLGRGRGFGHRVEHVNKQEITASAYISIRIARLILTGGYRSAH